MMFAAKVRILFVICKNFLYFFVGLGQFFLAQFDEYLRAFQLLAHRVDVKLIVFHSVYNLLQFVNSFFVFGSFFHDLL